MIKEGAAATEEDSSSFLSLGTRCGIGGLLMGAANLVPGISGGTMLLAAGIYPQFIRAIAAMSTLRFSKRAVFTLVTVVVAALITILLGAGPIKGLVVNARWVMYSIFIGLTLGGVPVLWAIAKPASRGFWMGATVGIVAMAMLAWAQTAGAGSADTQQGASIMFVAGVAGASAMILPGISGGYLLLVLGVYIPILGAIDAFKVALKAGDLSAATGPGMEVILPVALGVGVGALLVSNLLKWVLERFRQATLGVLMGFLVGAVFGLWPFQAGVAPIVGSTFKGRVMTIEMITELKPEKYPTAFFDPSASQIVAALLLIGAGFCTTVLIGKLGERLEGTHT